MVKLIMTPQRRVILEVVRDLDIHPTADEVYSRVRERIPRISLGTVYRNLEILTQSGMIRKLEVAGAQKRFDGKLGQHYHLRCMRCGRVEDAPGETLSSVERHVERESEYEILGHRLEFIGLCPDCKDVGGKGSEGAA
jgi:Fur family ferric uptake transcriptional regulator